LGRNQEALEAFALRVKLGGWPEEVFHSKLALAQLAQDLGKPWHEVLGLYLDAHAFAPHRAEPLYCIAFEYHRQGAHALAVLFARRGMDLPLPVERLFVDDDVYAWRLADLVGSSAYYLAVQAEQAGQAAAARAAVRLGEQAARNALAARPDDARLATNLACYGHRMG
jgi:hypothetical protein